MAFVANVMWILAICLLNASFAELDVASIERSNGPVKELQTEICSMAFRCLDGSGFYNTIEKCDGIAKCSDDSDEYDCETNYAACGISQLNHRYKRAFYGKDAVANTYPWMVRFKKILSYPYFAECGAVIFNNWWVITAGHCVGRIDQQSKEILAEYSLEDIRLTFGDHLKQQKDRGEVVKTIEKVVIHRNIIKF